MELGTFDMPAHIVTIRPHGNYTIKTLSLALPPARPVFRRSGGWNPIKHEFKCIFQTKKLLIGQRKPYVNAFHRI